MSNNVPQSGGIATADDAMLITFGDFTLEETERVLHQGTPGVCGASLVFSVAC